MGRYPTVKDIDIRKKLVIVRCGLDVPLDSKKDLLDPARVTDDTRIKDIIPTLRYLIENDAKVILAAGWCGRPKGEDADYSMAPVAKRLEKILKENGLLRADVLIAPNSYDGRPRSVYKNKEEVKRIVQNLSKSQVVVLENVRYDSEANANDKEFASFFASLGQVYINENEVQNHRPEATIVEVPKIIAKKGGRVAYGFQYANVLENIGGLQERLKNPNRAPFVFGLCGKKIESDPGITSKITVALDLIDKMKKGDVIITGGAVVYTFLLAEHYKGKIEANLSKVKDMVARYNKDIVEKTKSTKDKEAAKKLVDDLQKEKSSGLKELLGITDSEIKSLVGSSYIRWGQEGEQIVFAYDLMAKASAKGIEVITAIDHTITNSPPDKAGKLPESAEIKIHPSRTGIPLGYLGIAEGPKTLDKIS
ncbi:MAG TPA: phosphoglycerate kinase, partial [Candidatus Nanoarchaeia archaeon]|nr:phosphoglycerate kinase [Candidatus Nanoarchaeia archaeon]